MTSKSNCLAFATPPRFNRSTAKDKLHGGQAVGAIGALLFFAALCLPAEAQSVSFDYAISTLPGANGAGQIAADAAGDLFVAFGSQVVKFPAGCSTSNCGSAIASGISASGVTVSAAGDVFLSDSANSRVVKVPAGGGAQTTVVTGVNSPGRLAVTPAGDLAIIEYPNNPSVTDVIWIPHGCSTRACGHLFGGGLVQPNGVAADAFGNVFVSDLTQSDVLKFPASGGSQVVSNRFYGPAGLATDRAGDLFIAGRWLDSGYGPNTVLENPVGGGAAIRLQGSYENPTDVAVDGFNNVFIRDDNSICGLDSCTSNPIVWQLQHGSVNFGSANVGASSSITLHYLINSNVTLGASVSVVTQGLANRDFTGAGTPTCTGIQTMGQACTVIVQFAPTATGLRMGAVELVDSLGNLVATTPVYGNGLAPIAAFTSTLQRTVTAGNVFIPNAVAVDAAGDVFTADGGNGSVWRAAPNVLGVRIWDGLDRPYAVALNGAGDLFIANTFNNQVVRVPAGCASVTCQTTVGTGLSLPYGIAVDGTGAVFIADTGNNRILKVNANCAASPCQSVVDTGTYGLNLPQAVTTDGAGNLFIADTNGSRVIELLAGGNTWLTVNAGLYPTGVAVDAAGDVYIADTLDNEVAQIPASCATSACQSMVGSGLSGPNGVAVDGSGNVYIADTGNSAVREVPRTVVPSLTFPATQVNTTGLPQTITVQNTGNLGLAFTSISASANFNVDQRTTTCSTSSPLGAGASCNVGVTCSPVANGFFDGALTLTDNALNGVNVTQSATLFCSASGGLSQPTVTFTGAPATAGYQSTFMVTATTNASTLPSISGAGGCSVGSVIGMPASSSALVTMTSGAIACSLTANWAADANYAATSLSQSTTAQKATPTVTFTGAPATAVFGSTFTVAASSNSSTTVMIAASGACSISGTAVTMTSGAGACSLTANWATDANYVAASLLQSTTAQKATPTVTFTGAPATAVFGSTFTVASSTSASTAAVVTASGACSISGVMVTMTSGTGPCSLTANWAADANYAAASRSESTTAQKATPTVTFTGAPASAASGSIFIVTATTNASTVATITAAGACSVAGTRVTMTSNSGTCQLTANWASDPNYLAASAGQSTITPGVMVTSLTTLLNSFNLSNPNTFASPLQALSRDLQKNDLGSACSDLTTLIGAVNAQSGKKLTVAQAQQLLTAAVQIQAIVGCS